MPLYEYQCEEHGIQTEIRGIALREQSGKCVICGRETIYSPSFVTQPPVFKGNGFYGTDYKRVYDENES